MSSPKQPRTLIEAVRHFSDPDVCTEFVASLRWPNGAFCPRCGSTEYSYLTTRRLWKCKACKKQYSVKVGTIFEDSKLGLDKWLPAVWLAANSKNGTSSHELARQLGVTQKSAWFMLHRIHLAMKSKGFVLSGEVEVDETYVGGKVGYMKRDARKRKGITRRGGISQHKTAVMGFRERGSGRVQARVIPDAKGSTLKPIVAERVKDGSTIYTDQWNGYTGQGGRFTHETVNHAETYVNGRVHTNGIENFWALLKRGLNGTYVSVEPEHLGRYIDERVFTYNLRDRDDYGRFSAVLSAVSGRRLTYTELIGKAS
ncbi:MAG TPA: IS1595 family transposase [Solirubrobacteraceae bacterium]